ncbi:hypothetical protein GU243_21805 [Pseudarthrobacter psychrotolerans]|uniref:Uncharacterized protein n=1 Tax=Pseudarthrobacter psychrotolerans TaxID=2697569 RepID=A0A6P1NRY9_9MICC|nr:hypothetical protein [Pseudarthrobacter psychrotolerans]QHK21863.1 hypothetical protein GU243_21805 [Pseudarthrobacter psychrotolerans]
MTTPAIAANLEVRLGTAIVFLGLLVFFMFCIRGVARNVRHRSELWTNRLRGISRAFLGIAICSLFLGPLSWTTLPEEILPEHDWTIICLAAIFLAFLVIHIAGEGAAKFLEPYDRPELIGLPLKSLLARALSSGLSDFKQAMELLKQRLLPDGFRDLRPRKLGSLPFRNEYTAFGVLYLALGVLSATSLFTLIGTGESALTQIVRTWSVFWVLMFAVSLTPSFTLAWLALKHASATGAIQCRITLRSSLLIVANWVSIGGVIGLLTGALSFLPLRFMAKSGVEQEPISLSILADLSLAGAVGGFIAAHFGVIFACTATMKNRLAALSLPVLTISAFTTGASLAGINPAANADYALALIRKSVVLPKDPVELAVQATTDWKTLLALGRKA